MSLPRFLILLGLFSLTLALIMTLSLGMGAVSIPVLEMGSVLGLNSKPVDDAVRAILLELRLPRVLLSALVGAALAGAGTAYQGLFRNPLADPFVIGAASGAALGAALAVVSSADAAPRAPLVPLLAFLGAVGAVALVYLLGSVGGQASPVTLLLAGAAVSTVFGSAVSLLMILRDQSLQVIFTWLLGGFSTSSWSDVGLAAPVIVGGLLWLGLLARPLNALTLGEESARSLGLSLNRTRLSIVLAATLVTATAVCVAGIIAFVGLVAPHAARLLFGSRHERLIPASAILGALLLVLADDLARWAAAPLEIPVGIITSLIGGPFFLYLLKTRRGWSGT